MKKIDESKINIWKEAIINNPNRLQEEKDVIRKYGGMFRPDNLDNLTKEDFKSFLLFRNNKHWEGIHRQGNLVTADMNKLKKALEILLDEDKDIRDRLNKLFPPNNNNFVKGLGRAIITPILLVVYPQKYGVYNSKSEEGLKRMGLLPRFKKSSFADKYIEVNKVLNDLATRYQVTLWQLDEIVGWMALGNPPINISDEDIPPVISADPNDSIEDYENFALESHLEDFIVENWEKLELSKKYSLLEEDGDIVGQQYLTKVGIIDLLAKSKDDKEWLVIELKKGRPSDKVVGQLLRYLGWIKKHKAEKDQNIRGLIIAKEEDEKLKYALETIDNIKLATYSINFKLDQSIE